MRERLNAEGVPMPRGPYSQAVITTGRRIVWLSGQVSLDATGTLVGRGDPEQQTRQIFKNLLALLRHVGGEIDDIVKLTTYDTDIDSHAEAIRRVRREVFGSEFPASTKVQVARLADPDYLIEIDAIAVLDGPE